MGEPHQIHEVAAIHGLYLRLAAATGEPRETSTGQCLVDRVHAVQAARSSRVMPAKSPDASSADTSLVPRITVAGPVCAHRQGDAARGR